MLMEEKNEDMGEKVNGWRPILLTGKEYFYIRKDCVYRQGNTLICLIFLGKLQMNLILNKWCSWGFGVFFFY